MLNAAVVLSPGAVFSGNAFERYALAAAGSAEQRHAHDRR